MQEPLSAVIQGVDDACDVLLLGLQSAKLRLNRKG
jgi:hypothetical protein